MGRKQFFRKKPIKYGKLTLENSSASGIIKLDVYRFWAFTGLLGPDHGARQLRGSSNETGCPAEAGSPTATLRSQPPGQSSLSCCQEGDRD